MTSIPAQKAIHCAKNDTQHIGTKGIWYRFQNGMKAIQYSINIPLFHYCTCNLHIAQKPVCVSISGHMSLTGVTIAQTYNHYELNL